MYVQLEDFESLAIKCKDPSVIAERHHARSGLATAGGLNGNGAASIARIEQRQASIESQLRQMKTKVDGGSPAAAGASPELAEIQKQVADLMKFKAHQDGVMRALQSKVAMLEEKLADRDAAAAAAAAAAAELVAAGAD
jgi:uncharacterized protein involved in exopolysaccharide biosynthesis